MSPPAAKRPQLTLDELHQLRWLLGGVLTLLAVWTVLYMEIRAWTLMLLTSAATLATLAWPTLPARVPRVLHTLAFPAIVTFFVGDLWLFGEVLPAMVRLDMLLLLYRSLSFRQRRDDLQIIVLGLFLIVVAGVLTVSLTFAAQILAYTACALVFLLVITLTDAAARASGGEEVKFQPQLVAPSWAVQLSWPALFRRLRAALDWRVAGFGAVLFVAVVGVSALLFLAIPRFQLQTGMFLERFVSKKAKSGFNDTIRFGEVTEIQQDDSVALSVDVSDPSQIPGAPYWRMLVLDSYENGTFRTSPWLKQELAGRGANWFLPGNARGQRGPAVQWTFYLESGVSRYLPLLGQFESITFRESQNFQHAPRLVVVALRDDPVTMTAYRVQGFDLAPRIIDADYAKRLRDPDPQVQTRVGAQRRLYLPVNDVGVLRGIARELTGGEALSATEFAQRANAWLRRNHDYTLEPKIPDGTGDPLVRWLASKEKGHCELFAGSFVLLARAAGFPARVVTGFRGGMWNAYSANFTLRNADAHAWAEIFDEPAAAWLRTDPLGDPMSGSGAQDIRGEAALAARMDRSWGARLDSLRVFWYRRIVSFDQRSQLETLKSVKEATEATGRRLRQALEDAAARVHAWIVRPWDARRFAGVFGVAVVLTALGWLWREFGREWWRRFARRSGERGADPVRREAGRLLAAFAELGVGAAGAVDPIPALQRLRFGARATWRDPDGVIRQARRVLRERRRAATPS